MVGYRIWVGIGGINTTYGPFVRPRRQKAHVPAGLQIQAVQKLAEARSNSAISPFFPRFSPDSASKEIAI